MRKSRVIGAMVVALGTVALAGGLIASNMGFKLNKTMIAGTQATTRGETVSTQSRPSPVGIGDDGAGTVAGTSAGTGEAATLGA